MTYSKPKLESYTEEQLEEALALLEQMNPLEHHGICLVGNGAGYSSDAGGSGCSTPHNFTAAPNDPDNKSVIVIPMVV